MALPKEKFFVEMKRGKVTVHQHARAGAVGGTVNSLEAAQTRKTAILRAHPDAEVKVYRSKTEWIEVDETASDRKRNQP